MKIKNLTSCAKDDMAFTLLDETDNEGQIVRQYVMLSERAIYPLDGLPIMSEHALMTVMDIPPDRQSCWNVNRAVMNERTKAMMADAKATDVELDMCYIGIAMNGVGVQPVLGRGTNDSVGFVESDLLKVLADYRDLTIAERRVDGSRVYVMLNGMCNVGCLMPTKAQWSKNAARQLARVGGEAARVYARWEEEDERTHG